MHFIALLWVIGLIMSLVKPLTPEQSLQHEAWECEDWDGVTYYVTTTIVLIKGRALVQHAWKHRRQRIDTFYPCASLFDMQSVRPFKRKGIHGLACDKLNRKIGTKDREFMAWYATSSSRRQALSGVRDSPRATSDSGREGNLWPSMRWAL